VNLAFNMHTDAARNDGKGTIGICNNGSEHVMRDACSITANLPLVDHNGLQVTVTHSSDHPTHGDEYEEPYVGSVSCTVHDNRNMILISLDSFRAWWAWQVAHVEFPSLYTSTRTNSLTDVTPLYTESFYITGGGFNIRIHADQETSGVVGSTYRMDHRYITFGGGAYANCLITVIRTPSDVGFVLPADPSSSIHLSNTTQLFHCDLNCNYNLNTYDETTDAVGLAVLPVTFSATPEAIRATKFTLDHSGSHDTDIFADIDTFCTNVESVNFLTGETEMNPP
jgi:hypothetical protein